MSLFLWFVLCLLSNSTSSSFRHSELCFSALLYTNLDFSAFGIFFTQQFYTQNNMTFIRSGVVAAAILATLVSAIPAPAPVESEAALDKRWANWGDFGEFGGWSAAGYKDGEGTYTKSGDEARYNGGLGEHCWTDLVSQQPLSSLSLASEITNTPPHSSGSAATSRQHRGCATKPPSTAASRRHARSKR